MSFAAHFIQWGKGVLGQGFAGVAKGRIIKAVCVWRRDRVLVVAIRCELLGRCSIKDREPPQDSNKNKLGNVCFSLWQPEELARLSAQQEQK